MSETSYAPHVPDAVRRASLLADELAREAGILNVPPLPEGEDQPAGGDATTVVAEPEQPELFEQEQLPRTAPPQESRPDNWEQRYNTLRGKYDTELPELRGQLRAMQDTINHLQQQRFQPPEPAPTREVRLPRRDPPPEDIESYGPDLVSAAQRWAALALEPELDTLRQRVVQLEASTQQNTMLTATQHVDAALDRAVPVWRELNKDLNFIAWLNQVDPFSGQTRKVMADGAYAAGEASRVIAFFQAYENEHTAVRQPPGIQPNQTDNSADRLPLADLAVPGRGAAASPPTPGAPQRRIWTGADILAFYRQQQRGVWAGREAEAARIEADIFAAQHEGRIRQ